MITTADLEQGLTVLCTKTPLQPPSRAPLTRSRIRELAHGMLHGSLMRGCRGHWAWLFLLLLLLSQCFSAPWFVP